MAFKKSTTTGGVDTRENFDLTSTFLGYRNKEDITNLPEKDSSGKSIAYLVTGSQNVVTNASDRIQIRQGYTLDGPTDTSISSVRSSFDWEMHTGITQHLRVGFLTSVGNDGKLQTRYVATGTDYYLGVALTKDEVIYPNLVTGLTSTDFNFADYWDDAHVQAILLFVNGASEINEWSGGITTYASSTANTITKQGAETFAELGFYTTGSHTISILGVTYAVTGGWDTTTLTGVAPDPTGAGITPGELIIQEPETTLNSSMTSLPDINNDLIVIKDGQVYVGSFTNRSIFVSNVNDYKDYSFSTPRLTGEGKILTLDGNPVGLVAQENAVYITAGKDQWYTVTPVDINVDLGGVQITTRDLDVSRLKTTALQAAKSQGLIGKIKNSVIFVNNEPTFDELGRVENILGTPQSTNYSDPIKIDFNNYDFTDGHVIYHKYFIYISVPKEGKFLMYNMAKSYWEPPQIASISCWSIIDGNLYGHSYLTSETYKMFDGYNDNGNPIDAKAVFSYRNYGIRELTKYMNEFYVEGYINPNTILTTNIQYEIDGCATLTSYDLKGTDTQNVCVPISDASLGKVSLGKNPLGSTKTSVATRPPKFRVIFTFPRKDFFETQYSFTSSGADYHWELLAFGGLVTRTMFGQNDIKK